MVKFTFDRDHIGRFNVAGIGTVGEKEAIETKTAE